MDSFSDQQLLRDYAAARSEAAFAELARRHVDFVYSAAFRIVRNAHLAEDVTQGVFTALAQSAGQLESHPVLSGWLHRTTRNIAAQIIRTDTRRRAREQEAFAMHDQATGESNTLWEQIAPHLDVALGELTEPDRDALLLRFFERKSAREMAEILKISDEAAQKRVARAVERLRERFAANGLTIGASGLIATVSANAVQAAPVGLVLTVSAIAGTTLATTIATHATANWITMKMLTAIAAATFIGGAGTYLYQRDLNDLNHKPKVLSRPMGRNVVPLTAQMPLPKDVTDPRETDQSELRRLRGEVGQLRQQLEMAKSQSASTPASGQKSTTGTVHAPGSYIPADKLAHQGFATPEAAWESVAWALIHGTHDQVTEGFSPNLRAAELKNLRGPDELAAGQAQAAATFKGMQIMAKKVVADDRVELKVKTEEAITCYHIQVMGKFDGEWRFGGSVGYYDTWDNEGQVQTFVE